jgi:hypothetical protein
VVSGRSRAGRGHTHASVRHVLLISVDGLHQSDLEWYARTHRSSTLAELATGGREYTHAQTPIPSDSFPGMVGQATVEIQDHRHLLRRRIQPRDVIDPAQLPVSATTCKPVYPHSYLTVNTIFEVARAHGLRTAWSDKHPAYEILDGPSGAGVQTFFTPEINSQAPGYGDGNDWTKDNAATMQYDSYKVGAVLNGRLPARDQDAGSAAQASA